MNSKLGMEFRLLGSCLPAAHYISSHGPIHYSVVLSGTNLFRMSCWQDYHHLIKPTIQKGCIIQGTLFIQAKFADVCVLTSIALADNSNLSQFTI